MKIDVHVHVADVEALLKNERAGQRFTPTGFLSRRLRAASADGAANADTAGINARWLHRLSGWLQESPLDAMVLLALDAVYDEAGRRRPDLTVLHVENDFVAAAVNAGPGFIFGASVHPYRRDAVTELERVVKQGACLVKWIPSAQRIQPDAPRCYPFYEAMAHHRMPLLCHTGVEHMLGIRRADYNHPRRLVPALERGVTVIAAHCGARLFLHEPSFFRAWASLARSYDQLYGDCGACSVVTRIPGLQHILKDPVLQSKLLYGSDFPGIPSPRWCWQLGLGTMRKLSALRNPLTRNMRVMQSLGVPPEAFERAHGCLGIGKDVWVDAR